MAEMASQRPGPVQRFLPGGQVQPEGRALQDAALEQAARGRVLGESGDRERAAGLPGQRDARRVAAEGGDISHDPLQRRDLVSQPGVRVPDAGQEAQRA